MLLLVSVTVNKHSVVFREKFLSLSLCCHHVLMFSQENQT